MSDAADIKADAVFVAFVKARDKRGAQVMLTDLIAEALRAYAAEQTTELRAALRTLHNICTHPDTCHYCSLLSDSESRR
jgi:hypothetical protein